MTAGYARFNCIWYACFALLQAGLAVWAATPPTDWFGVVLSGVFAVLFAAASVWYRGRWKAARR